MAHYGLSYGEGEDEADAVGYQAALWDMEVCWFREKEMGCEEGVRRCAPPHSCTHGQR